MDLEQWCLGYKRRGLGRLRRVAMREWDPIGVAGIPEARDEYDGYLGLIAERLRRDSSVEEVAALLGSITSEWMGLSSDRDANVRIAERLRTWYASEMARWKQSLMISGR